MFSSIRNSVKTSSGVHAIMALVGKQKKSLKRGQRVGQATLRKWWQLWKPHFISKRLSFSWTLNERGPSEVEKAGSNGHKDQHEQKNTSHKQGLDKGNGESQRACRAGL